MPVMKSPIDLVISSLSGHCLCVDAGVPIHVPDSIEDEAFRAGMRRTDEAVPAEGALTPTAEILVAPAQKDDNEAEFAVELDKALLKILAGNNEANFKADGTPKVTSVVAQMDPRFRRATATEIARAYEKLQENLELSE